MRLPIHTPESTPAPAKIVLDGIAEDLGFVPNMAATIAESPALLAGFDGLRRAVGATQLDPVHREIAGLAVGVAVDNAYGVAFHSTVLDRLGIDGAEVDKMRAGNPPSDATCADVYALAQELTLTRGKVSHEAVGRLIDAGFPPSAILDIVTEATFAGLVGVVDNLAGRVQLDDFLLPRAWR
jgi:alkylhydroperoxidase family enzyme